MTSRSSRFTVLALVVASLAILVPGLFLPVLTIRGVLTSEGIAKMTPIVLEKGLDDETVATLERLLNPAMLEIMKLTGGSVRKVVLEQLGPKLTAALQQGAADIEVYRQTRSIAGAVGNLYDVGSPIAATLILLFSVVVPITKAGLVAWAAFMKDPLQQMRTTRFVAAIAKWSMADVFVVALFITYLAAEATQTPPGDPSGAPLIAFDASFGPGFYWFAAYCLFSLASQQYTARLARTARTRAA